jgi:hypothetical protein
MSEDNAICANSQPPTGETGQPIPLHHRAISGPPSSNPREAATWWIERGFSPIPVPTRCKSPGAKKWQELRVNAANAPEYFDGQPQNIGILLGHNNAADCDLDSREAVEIAPQYLPTTGLTFGRRSKPRSHWLYRSAGLKTERFTDPLENTTILELRGLKNDGSIGLQTVVPPGVHVTGETIEFAEHGSPAEVPPAVLRAAASKVAAGALLARHWPAHGRHSSMLALAGILARANWPIEETKKFCRVMYSAVPTHDRAATDRSDLEVSSTYEKRFTEEITGFPTLANLIDRCVVTTALEWLGIKSEAADWRKGLITTTNGVPRPILANACIALRLAPEWAGVLAFDEFSHRTVVRKSTPWGRDRGTWADEDDIRTAEWLQHRGVLVSSNVTAEAVDAVSRESRFHPVRTYLESITWDNLPRVDRWLSIYLGVEDTMYASAVGRCWLISAVARIFQPGAQADATLVLEGDQGTRKSSALRVLASDQWFTDTLSKLGSKDAREELQGIWIAEYSDLDRIKGAALERVKSFLTSRADHYRKSYGHRAETYPRSCVFAASTNDLDYLTDETGGRRFWPVRCGEIAIEALAGDRDQLWGEAYALFCQGKPWWLDNRELEDLAAVQQEGRYSEGVWDDLITEWIAPEIPSTSCPIRYLQRRPHDLSEELPWFGSTPDKVNATDCLVHAVGKNPADIRSSDATAVGRYFRHMGWKQSQEGSGPHRGKRYFLRPAKKTK